MSFEVIRNDITLVAADAIVNTANPHPVIGSGTDYAIHQAAGPELLEARMAIGDIAPGCAVETPAFGLNAKYVLHTVGPVWVDGCHGEPALLRQAYDAALSLAEKLGCQSVAFPLMAAGSYGFPKDRALQVAIRAFTDFLLEHDMKIFLVIFGGKAFSLAASLFDDLKSYIDAHYVAEKAAREYSAFGRRQRRELDELREYQADYAASMPLEESAMLSDMEEAAAPKAPMRPAMPAAPTAKAARKDAAVPNDLDDYLGRVEQGFTAHLLDLLREKGEKDSTVYHRSGMSRQLFNKIINTPDYRPTKNTALQLAVGLELDVAGTQKLLGKAGYALSRSSKSDLVVEYFLRRREYSIVAINMALYDCGLPLLCK